MHELPERVEGKSKVMNDAIPTSLKHGFYDGDFNHTKLANDRYVGGSLYDSEDVTVYVHQNEMTLTYIRPAFRYDKCSKGFLKSGGVLTPACRSHDGWYGAEYLTFSKANLEFYYAARVLGVGGFRSGYHAAFTQVFGMPFIWYQGTHKNEDEIRKTRETVRLFRKNKRGIWVDTSDEEPLWKGMR